MTRYFLQSLSIEGFRGINNQGDPLVLKFKQGAVNSIHAPNGFGKSSIFEALNFAIHGEVPRLKMLQDAEQGNNYILNRFHSGQQATIVLSFAADDSSPDVAITVTRDAAGARAVTSPSGHPNPERFLEALQEDFVLVDYARFASFIDSSALERGRSLASLVGLNRYSRLRQALDGAKNTRNINSDLGLSGLDTEVTTATRALAAVERRVLAAHNEITSANITALTDIKILKTAVTAAMVTIVLLKKLIGEKSIMDLDFDAAEKAVEKEEGGDARKTLDALNSTIVALSALVVDGTDHADIDRLVVLAKQRDDVIRKVGTSAIYALLKDALIVVTGDDWRDPLCCPVCEEQSKHPLKDKLEAKIALYDEVTRLDSELVREVRVAASVAKLRQLEEAAAMSVLPENRVYSSIILEIQRGSVTTKSIEQAKGQLKALEQRRVEVVTAATAKTAKIQATLPPSLVQVTRMLSLAKQFRDAVLEYESGVPSLRAKQAHLKRLNRWRAFINSAAENFGKAETDLANDRIAEIQTACQDLFTRLVRGGPDVKPTLSRAQNSENVDLKLADFFGLKNLSARALLSESYRNAVAAAIFLSAATKQKGVPRFMVLDDVTSSFDAGHQFALMDAIRTQLRYGATTDGLQFIILSHDTSLEKYFDKLNNTTDWHHQKLQGMCPIGRLMVSAQEADRLKSQAIQHLNAGMVDIGAPLVRQYMEYKLGQVISKLEIPVPPDYATRGDKRTLSTYINAITEAVELYQAAGRCVLEAQQVNDLKNVHTPSIMGNFISHYETGVGSPFGAYALLGVLQSTDDLVNCFTHTNPSNGQKRFYHSLAQK